jgi:hypothetical protein
MMHIETSSSIKTGMKLPSGAVTFEQSSAIEKSVGIPIVCPAVGMEHNGFVGG